MTVRCHAVPDASRPTGFSLVELLIAVTLGGFVVAAAFALLNTQQQSVRTEDVRRELQQNSRYALDLLRRDLQEAGEGMDPTPTFGVIAMGNGDDGGPDTVYVLSVEPDVQIHDAEPPAGGGGFAGDSAKLTIRCNDDVDDVEEGTFLYFAHATERGLAVVRGTEREVSGTCGASGPPADSIGHLRLGIEAVDGGGHGWVLEANRADAGVSRVQAVAYFIDDRDPDNPRLMRATRYTDSDEWDGRPLADGVTDLQARLVVASGDTLLAADGTDSDPENDYDDITTVLLELETQARRADKDIRGGERLTRRYALSVTPRNQVYTRNLDI